MYKKVIECLKDYGYYFYEYDSVFFREEGFRICNVIGIEAGDSLNFYLEFDNDGDILVRDIDGKVVKVVVSTHQFKMLFELGRVLANLI